MRKLTFEFVNKNNYSLLGAEYLYLLQYTMLQWHCWPLEKFENRFVLIL